jgi:hypothetical protein
MPVFPGISRFLHFLVLPGIIHQQTEGVPECFEEGLLMLVGGWMG